MCLYTTQSHTRSDQVEQRIDRMLLCLFASETTVGCEHRRSNGGMSEITIRRSFIHCHRVLLSSSYYNSRGSNIGPTCLHALIIAARDFWALENSKRRTRPQKHFFMMGNDNSGLNFIKSIHSPSLSSSRSSKLIRHYHIPFALVGV